MTINQKGFTLVELMLAVAVVGIGLMGLMKLLSSSQVSLAGNIISLQTQGSAEEVLQQIRLMRWDQNKKQGFMMPLAPPDPGPYPQITCDPCNNPRQTIEDWTNYSTPDNTRPFGRIRRRVSVEFVRLDGNTLVNSAEPTNRKKVTVWAWSPTRKSSASVTSVFYNLP